MGLSFCWINNLKFSVSICKVILTNIIPKTNPFQDPQNFFNIEKD